MIENYAADRWRELYDKSCARIAELEADNTDARMFLAALVKGLGGEVAIPDAARIEVGPKMLITVETDRTNRTTWVRVQ